MWIILRTIIHGLFLVMVMFRVSSALALESRGAQRVWGELSSSYRVRESGASDTRSSNFLNTGTILGSGYIWRPWFALVNGSLSLSVEETDIEDQPDSTNDFITGDGRFSLFPTSRFPFSAYFIESRNEFASSAVRRDITDTEYGFSQLYRSLDGKHNYRAEYENNEQDDSDNNRFIADRLSLGSVNRFGQHYIDTEIRLDTLDNTTTDEQADRQSITLDHSYGNVTSFSLDNLLSASTSESDLFDSTATLDTSQLSSFLSWRPQNRGDLRVTANLRLSEISDSEQPDDMALEPVERETVTANLNQGLIYDITNNLQLSESINANSVETDGEYATTYGESLSARYLSDRSIMAWGDYGWSVSTSYVNLHGDIESEQSLINQFSQSLLNDYSAESGYQLRTNLTQSLNYDYESERADEKSIDHSYSVTWSNSAIENQNLIRLLLSDSRNLNRYDDNFQLINFQYTGSMRLSRYSQLGGNLTLQRSNREFQRLRTEETTRNGQLGYRNSRAFGVPGLIFLSDLQLSKRDSENERVVQGPDFDTEASLENSLQYRIGRLEMELDVDFIKVGDRYDRLFKFQITRSFGDL